MNVAPILIRPRSIATRIFLTTGFILLVILSLHLPVVSAETTTSGVSPVDNWIAEAKDAVWGEYPTVQDPWPIQNDVGDLNGLDLPSRSNPQQQIEPEIDKQQPKSQPEPTPAATEIPATVVPVVTPAPSADWLSEFIRLTNAAREKNSLEPLSLHSTLCQAADIRVSELPASPSPHLRPDGDAFYTVLADVNLTASYCGENYAIDPTQAATAEQIVNAWLNSPTHRKNIMNGSFTGIALSKRVVNGSTYYEQLFIG
ncbi:MAG: CAP domain-containing protein [Clostridia bacterium]|nr:CAP domain-containing protein [Clostridia bacterium]